MNINVTVPDENSAQVLEGMDERERQDQGAVGAGASRGLGEGHGEAWADEERADPDRAGN